MAAAAVLLLGVSVAVLTFIGTDELAPRQVWAAAIENASQLQSVHFRFTTPSAGSGSAVEMWWRRPHDYRMVFSNGLVMTGNKQKACVSPVGGRNVRVFDAAGPGLEMAILGELGELFTSDVSFSREWVRDSEVLSSEPIDYKGEGCRRIVAEKDSRYYVYIIDSRAAKTGQKPLLYDVKRYAEADMSTLLSHVEVLEIDVTMPESLFTIEPPDAAR